MKKKKKKTTNGFKLPVCVVQIVKLLLQYGSYVSAKTLRGLSAMDLAEEENIKMLLQASLVQEQSCNAQNRQAGQETSFFAL